MKEVWKDIEGYEGKYQISNYGRVKSFPKWVKRRNCYILTKEKILKPKIDKDGYILVNLYSPNRTFKIHRLVAQAFIPNPDNLPIINHKDCNPSNNIVFNLEWCDYHYNNSYPLTSQKRIKSSRNGKHSFPILQYDLEGNLLNEYPSIREASRQLGVSNGNITLCCSDKYPHSKTAYGFIWKYKTKVA